MLNLHDKLYFVYSKSFESYFRIHEITTIADGEFSN